MLVSQSEAQKKVVGLEIKLNTYVMIKQRQQSTGGCRKSCQVTGMCTEVSNPKTAGGLAFSQFSLFSLHDAGRGIYCLVLILPPTLKIWTVGPFITRHQIIR